ncbi:MAG: DUF1206 domain-containing protein, partial [Acidobacteriota bacterium]|nr:DUF1206 domain-containing protein [Acidobacteriota bacterium]
LSAVQHGTFRSIRPGMIERLARLGYACIGFVYMIVGGFAIAAGLDKRGAAGSQKDAFAFIAQQPFGSVVLCIIALGLAGYTLWRFVSAITDEEHRGSNAKGFAIRIASFARGLIYAGIATGVVRMAMHRSSGGGSGGEQQAKHWTAKLMDAPFGRWILAIAGLSIVAAGAYQLYAALDAKLSKRISLGDIDARVRRKVIGISRFGIGARAIVFFVIGGSLVLAALRHDPNDAHSTSGALQALPDPLLALVGVGFIAYGVYALVNARYRRMAGA